ncbi:hypothetical protein [Tenacibaculum soleae]|uniref:hypothetical protein n=1 Tax=Tenacibaculum soleae TaxID=447689 RepID=UPI00159F009C|nr:hypothetical protein [Tenacibaculum soleae]
MAVEEKKKLPFWKTNVHPILGYRVSYRPVISHGFANENNNAVPLSNSYRGY